MNFTRAPRQGVALITVLLITVPLVMMLTAALSLVGQGAFTSLTYHDRMEALYAAEAGIVYAIEHLQQSGGEDWEPGGLSVQMPNGRSSFELSFGPSVNNLLNPGPANGPRGDDTVPPDSVDLIVTGRSGSATRTLEVIIARRGAISIDEPILASGRIEMHGVVQTYGVKDLNDWEPVAAGLHSNYDQNVTDIVTWDGISTSTADGIFGDISVVSSNPGAINISSTGTVAGDRLLDQPKRVIKDFDVEGEIANHSGAPAPPPPDANGVVVLTDGDYYVGSNYELSGRIELQNANLYVSGNLQVEGAVAGSGSIYVDGETRLRGDTHLNQADPDQDLDPDVGLGLFSSGNVILEGYDGEQYMEDLVSTLPADHEITLAWNDSRRAIGEMNDLLQTYGWNGFTPAVKNEFDSLRRVVGQTLPNPIPSWASGQAKMQVLVSELQLQSQPPLETRDFLIRKFQGVGETYDAATVFYPGTGAEAKRTALMNYVNQGDTRALIDSALDFYYDGVDDPLDITFRAASGLVEELDLGRLGSAYFQGVVYTEGYLDVSQHLTIVGGIIAKAEPTTGPGLRAGDVRLSNGATIIYPKDAFRFGRGVGGTGQLGVRSWISK